MFVCGRFNNLLAIMKNKIRFLRFHVKSSQVRYVKTFIFLALLMDFLSIVDVYQLFYSELNVYFWINLAFSSTLGFRVYGFLTGSLVKNGRLKAWMRGAIEFMTPSAPGRAGKDCEACR